MASLILRLGLLLLLGCNFGEGFLRFHHRALRVLKPIPIAHIDAFAKYPSGAAEDVFLSVSSEELLRRRERETETLLRTELHSLVASLPRLLRLGPLGLSKSVAGVLLSLSPLSPLSPLRATQSEDQRRLRSLWESLSAQSNNNSPSNTISPDDALLTVNASSAVSEGHSDDSDAEAVVFSAAIAAALTPMHTESETEIETLSEKAKGTSSESEGVSLQRRPSLSRFLSRSRSLPWERWRTLGIAGNWTQVGENFLLFPPDSHAEQRTPKAVLHFLGAGVVGAAPQWAYRLLLESLAARGYVIVATPYRLNRDRLATCDGVLRGFEPAQREITRRCGRALPVVGVGHGGGALLHLLLSSLFPAGPTENIGGISYYNKTANVFLSIGDGLFVESVPGFREVLLPFAKRVLRSPATSFSVRALRDSLSAALRAYSSSSLSPPFVQNELLPLVRDGLAVLDQLPPLLRSLSSSEEEENEEYSNSEHAAQEAQMFSPSLAQAKDAARMLYRSPHTLLVRFADEKPSSGDASAVFESILSEANTIMKMRKDGALSHMTVESALLSGSHCLPLTQSFVANLSEPTSFFRVATDDVERNRAFSNTHRSALQQLKEVVRVVDSFVQNTLPRDMIASSDIIDSVEVTTEDNAKENWTTTAEDILTSPVVECEEISESKVILPLIPFDGSAALEDLHVTQLSTEVVENATSPINIDSSDSLANDALAQELTVVTENDGESIDKYQDEIVPSKEAQPLITSETKQHLSRLLETTKSFAQQQSQRVYQRIADLWPRAAKKIADEVPILVQHFIVVSYLYFVVRQ